MMNNSGNRRRGQSATPSYDRRSRSRSRDGRHNQHYSPTIPSSAKTPPRVAKPRVVPPPAIGIGRPAPSPTSGAAPDRFSQPRNSPSFRSRSDNRYPPKHGQLQTEQQQQMQQQQMQLPGSSYRLNPDIRNIKYGRRHPCRSAGHARALGM